MPKASTAPIICGRAPRRKDRPPNKPGFRLSGRKTRLLTATGSLSFRRCVHSVAGLVELAGVSVLSSLGRKRQRIPDPRGVRWPGNPALTCPVEQDLTLNSCSAGARSRAALASPSPNPAVWAFTDDVRRPESPTTAARAFASGQPPRPSRHRTNHSPVTPEPWEAAQRGPWTATHITS